MKCKFCGGDEYIGVSTYESHGFHYVPEYCCSWKSWQHQDNVSDETIFKQMKIAKDLISNKNPTYDEEIEI